MRKIWAKDGNYKLRFNKTDTKRIRAWAHTSKVSYEDVIDSGIEVFDEILGHSWEFPCRIIEQ